LQRLGHPEASSTGIRFASGSSLDQASPLRPFVFVLLITAARLEPFRGTPMGTRSEAGRTEVTIRIRKGADICFVLFAASR